MTLRATGLIAALALVLLVPAALIGQQVWLRHIADDWILPVAGFDPMDPLRGRYLDVRVDWLWSEADHAEDGTHLCLQRTDAGLPRVTLMRSDARAGAGCDAVVPVTDLRRWSCTLDDGREITHRRVDAGLDRVFVDETLALPLEAAIQDREQVYIVRARITEAGRILLRTPPEPATAAIRAAMLDHRARHPPCPGRLD